MLNAAMLEPTEKDANASSRYEIVLHNEDRSSKSIMEALIHGFSPRSADARQSINFHRGTEFSAWRRRRDGIGADKSTFEVDLLPPHFYAAKFFGY